MLQSCDNPALALFRAGVPLLLSMEFLQTEPAPAAPCIYSLGNVLPRGDPMSWERKIHFHCQSLARKAGKGKTDHRISLSSDEEPLLQAGSVYFPSSNIRRGRER